MSIMKKLDTGDYAHPETGYCVYTEYMRPAEAARYIGCSRSFLDTARVKGNGIKFIKPSPIIVLYRRSDIDEWLAQRTVNSTSEDSPVNARNPGRRKRA